MVSKMERGVGPENEFSYTERRLEKNRKNDSPVCVFVYECVCGAGSGGRDGALWQPHHHGDSGIIASGGH